MTSDTVLCVGDVMVDVVTTLSRPLAAGADTPATISLRGGGSAANTACWLASLGIPVSLVAAVGDDPLGAASLSALGYEGLDLAVTVIAGAPTGTCVVLVGPGGDRTMASDAGANERLSRPEAGWPEAGHLHLSAYALLRAGSRPAALDALACARRRGMSISIGTAAAAPLRGLGVAAFTDLVGTGVLLLGNHDEAAALGGDARWLARRFGHAVVTRGARGASFSDGSAYVHESARVIDVVDAAGAGDAFTAGFLSAWRTGAGASAALRSGHEVASRAVASSGSRPDGAALR